jgi:hypothetical protein
MATFVKNDKAWPSSSALNPSSFAGVGSFHHLSFVNHCHIHFVVKNYFIIPKSWMPIPPWSLFIFMSRQLTKLIVFLSDSHSLCLYHKKSPFYFIYHLIIHFDNKNCLPLKNLKDKAAE